MSLRRTCGAPQTRQRRGPMTLGHTPGYCPSSVRDIAFNCERPRLSVEPTKELATLGLSEAPSGRVRLPIGFQARQRHLVKPVSIAVYRDQAPAVLRSELELVANPADVRVQGARQADGFCPPYRLEQVRAGQELADVAQQKRRQVKVFGGKRERLVVTRDTAAAS